MTRHMLFLHNNFYIALVRNMLHYSQFWIYFWILWFDHTHVLLSLVSLWFACYIFSTCASSPMYIPNVLETGAWILFICSRYLLYGHFKVSYMHIIQYFIKKCFLYLSKFFLLQRKWVIGLRFLLDGLEWFFLIHRSLIWLKYVFRKAYDRDIIYAFKYIIL